MLQKADVKKILELKSKTDLPLLKCRKALVETQGDIKKALKLLREQNPPTSIHNQGLWDGSYDEHCSDCGGSPCYTLIGDKAICEDCVLARD